MRETLLLVRPYRWKHGWVGWRTMPSSSIVPIVHLLRILAIELIVALQVHSANVSNSRSTSLTSRILCPEKATRAFRGHYIAIETRCSSM